MKLGTQPFRFSKHRINTILRLIPILCRKFVLTGTYQKLCLRKQQLIIEKTPSGVTGFAAKDRPFHLQMTLFCHPTAGNGIFISVCGRFFFPYRLFWHTAFFHDRSKEIRLCFILFGILLSEFRRDSKPILHNTVFSGNKNDWRKSFFP